MKAKTCWCALCITSVHKLQESLQGTWWKQTSSTTQCHGPWSYSSATRQGERNNLCRGPQRRKSTWVRISTMNGNKIVERTRYLFWNFEEFYRTVYTSSRHKLNCDDSLAGYVWFICLISNGGYTTWIAGTHCSNMNWSMDPHCRKPISKACIIYKLISLLKVTSKLTVSVAMVLNGGGCVSPFHPVFVLYKRLIRGKKSISRQWTNATVTNAGLG